jgi:hypothetical protein
MTSQSPRIYIYKITFEEVLYYYYGVHKEKKYGEEYWGSPKTNKWCWELYTPKKQILQLFDFTDDGWVEAQEVETRLIRPFYQTDKWCLNESCGGVISLDILRETGKKVVLKYKESKIGLFSLTTEQRSETGKKVAKMNEKNGTAIYGMTKEQKSEAGKIGGKMGGKKGGKTTKERKVGICGLSKEQRKENVKITNSQKWMCLETGYITNPGALSTYQKNRGIDTSKRVKIS